MHTILHKMTWAWQAAHYTVVPPLFFHFCFNDQWSLENEFSFLSSMKPED